MSWKNHLIGRYSIQGLRLWSTMHTPTSTAVNIAYSIFDHSPKFQSSTSIAINVLYLDLNRSRHFISWYRPRLALYSPTSITVDIAFLDFDHGSYFIPRLWPQLTFHTPSSTTIKIKYPNFNCSQRCINRRRLKSKLNIWPSNTINITHEVNIAYTDFDCRRHYTQ